MTDTSRWQRFVEAATSPPSTETNQAPRQEPPQESGKRVRGQLSVAVSTVAGLAVKRVRRLAALDEDVDDKPPTRTWDLRLVPPALVAWAGAAAFIRVEPAFGYWAGLAALLAAGSILLAGRRLQRAAPITTAAFPLLCLALISFSAAEGGAERTAGPIGNAINDGTAITAHLVITSDPAPSTTPTKFSGAVQYLLEATIVEATAAGNKFSAATPVLIIAGERWSDLETGQREEGAGDLQTPGAGDDVEALLFASTAPRLAKPAGQWDKHTTEIRRAFRDRSGALSPGAAELLPGMVLGDRSALSADLDAAMKRTGLTHLTAVSGANCSIILGVVFLLGYAARLPRWLAAVVALVALAGFVSLVRPDPSVLRAAVMGTIGIVAIMTGRGRRSPSLLCIAVVVLLSFDPWLSGSYAFILSVLATTGLIVFGSGCARWLGRWVPLWAAQAGAVAIAAQVFCAPVIVLLQPQLVTYSVPANVLVAPVIPVVTIAGMAAVLAMSLCPPLFPALLVTAAAGAQWVGTVARYFSSAPAAAIPWPEGATGVALMAAVSLGSLGLVWIVSSPARLRTAAITTSRLLPGEPSSNLNRSVTAGILGVVVGVAPGLLISGSGIMTGSSDWSIVACDVGQGDGLVVRTGAHSAIVVDTGPEPELMDQCLRQLRISTVDMLVITHMHADHSGGIAGVLKGRTVERAMVSTTDTQIPAGISSTLKDHGVEVTAAQKGQRGTDGRVRWHVLWPPKTHYSATENNSSIVMGMHVMETEGPALSALLTGDLEREGLRRLLAPSSASPLPLHSNGILYPGLDVLKVAHHGADNGGTALITKLEPAMALISVGADNDYGHPADGIIAALEQSGTHTGRTDEHGRVYIGKHAGILRMWSER